MEKEQSPKLSNPIAQSILERYKQEGATLDERRAETEREISRQFGRQVSLLFNNLNLKYRIRGKFLRFAHEDK